MRATVYILFPLLAWGLVGFTPIAAAETDVSLDNAALSYWQAFAVLPELTDEQDDLLGQWSQVPLDDSVAELLRKSENALGLLHRGAEMRRCRWGTALEEGPTVLLPHLSKARQIGRLACLRARYRYDNGDPQGAAQDVVDTLTLARHTGSEALLISVLVQFAIEEMAVEAIAPHLPDLSDGQIAQLTAQLSSLPAPATISQGIESERKWILGWLRRKFVASENAQDRERALRQLLGNNHPELEKARDYLNDAATIKEHLNEVGKYYDEMRRILDLPRSELQAAWSELEGRMKEDPNGLVQLLLPALGNAQQAEMAATVRLAMLETAIAIARDGDGALARHNDPAGDGPFGLQRRDGGFQLTSDMVYRDKPVQITFGKVQ